MRVTNVRKGRKNQGNCRECGTEIKRGDAYKWIKFRYGSKVVKCAACSFRSSEMTSSDKLSRIYSAQEALHDMVAGWDGKELSDLECFAEDCATELRDVADEYRESADSIREHFTDSPTADDCEEKADDIDSFADIVGEADFSEFNSDDDSKDAETRDEWAERMRDVARSLTDDSPV